MSDLQPPFRPGRSFRRWSRPLRLGALAGCLVLAVVGSASRSADAAATGMVDLGRASSYAVLSGASVGNTVSAPNAPHTTLRGGLAVKASAEPDRLPAGDRHRPL